MLKLVLDENISPALARWLWEKNVDNYPVRDRDKLRISDPRLFALAQSEERTVATINTAHFERLARKAETHHGVISIPSGGTREMQYDYVMRAVDYAREVNAIQPSFRDQIVYVHEDGDLEIEVTRREPHLREVTKTG